MTHKRKRGWSRSCSCLPDSIEQACIVPVERQMGALSLQPVSSGFCNVFMPEINTNTSNRRHACPGFCYRILGDRDLQAIDSRRPRPCVFDSKPLQRQQMHVCLYRCSYLWRPTGQLHLGIRRECAQSSLKCLHKAKVGAAGCQKTWVPLHSSRLFWVIVKYGLA